jgi:hypothetical protein
VHRISRDVTQLLLLSASSPAGDFDDAADRMVRTIMRCAGDAHSPRSPRWEGKGEHPAVITSQSLSVSVDGSTKRSGRRPMVPAAGGKTLHKWICSAFSDSESRDFQVRSVPKWSSECQVPAYPGKGHTYPYFKVQARDKRTLAWKDHRKQAFTDEESARRYRTELEDGLQTRVVRWDETGATPLGN